MTKNHNSLLLTPTEVGVMFRVDPKTVNRWADAGRLTILRTVGGHRRYLVSEVNDLLTGETSTTASAQVG